MSRSHWERQCLSRWPAPTPARTQRSRPCRRGTRSPCGRSVLSPVAVVDGAVDAAAVLGGEEARRGAAVADVAERADLLEAEQDRRRRRQR
eukprot:1741013-Prymnesium_polylepis.1